MQERGEAMYPSVSGAVIHKSQNILHTPHALAIIISNVAVHDVQESKGEELVFYSYEQP